MIQVYYGDGKGKTTAALGLSIRALGSGQKVAIIFFDKGGQNYNERKILDNLGIAYFSYGRDRRLSNNRFDFSLKDEDLAMAQKSMAQLLKIHHDYDLIVLDEVLNAIRLKMMPLQELLDYLDNKLPPNLELVLTGRGLWPEISERADLISEMKMIKHYFQKKLPAREGIEY
ncbi:MAG: cob(I)yrinic acid a,c-diamide adenosyltransferase [Candidatus Buchananbacteria bacterium]|nr:cob(I)yrinic acid a,c-diamide adenosyltransferase [Candidatus Buchananbacteria bacterium]